MSALSGAMTQLLYSTYANANRQNKAKLSWRQIAHASLRGLTVRLGFSIAGRLLPFCGFLSTIAPIAGITTQIRAEKKLASNNKTAEQAVQTEQPDKHDGKPLIAITADKNGHYYFDKVNIAGKSCKAMFDTGATGISLSQSQAQAIGLPLPKEFNHQAQTANGEVPAGQINATIKIGNIEFDKQVITIIQANQTEKEEPILIGTKLFEDKNMRIVIENKTLSIDRTTPDA